jgi:MATE family multidrug resistance protein
MALNRHIAARFAAPLAQAWAGAWTGAWAGASAGRTELGETVRLALPLVLTQLAWIAMLATDTAMIGRLGAEKLAGGTLGLMVFFFVYVGCFGLTTATASLASQFYGARQPRMVRRVVRQGLWVSVVLTVPCVVAFEGTGALLLWLGQPVEALPHADAYMSTLRWSLPFAVAFTVLRNFVSALNRPAVALWVMMTGVPLNAVLDYALIFGKFGLPRLELVGAGIATTAVNALMFLGLLLIAILRKPFSRYGILTRFWRLDWVQFGRIFQIGLPIAGMSLLEAGFFIGAVFVVGQFGVTAIAAHMIAIQMPHISYMVPMGLSQAATVRVGHAVGRRDAVGAYRAGWTAWLVTLAFMSCMTLVVLAVPEAFAAVFLDRDLPGSEAVLSLAVSFLFYAAFFQAADGMQAVAAGALRGLNDTAIPMVYAALSYWAIGLGSGYWLAFHAGFDGAGLWIGFVVGLSCAAILLTARLRRLNRRLYIPALNAASIR